MSVLELIVLLVGGWGRTVWQAVTLYSQSAKTVAAADASVRDSVSLGAAWSWMISSALGSIYSISIHAWPIVVSNALSVLMQGAVLVRVYGAREQPQELLLPSLDRK